jgi:hypothetical protein
LRRIAGDAESGDGALNRRAAENGEMSRKYEFPDKFLKDFKNQINEDPHHRVLSWEDCYNYFHSKNFDEELACLHLTAYLVSWGMYRGSTFLIHKNYHVHKAVVSELKKHHDLKNLGLKDIAANIDRINHLVALIKDHYGTTNVNRKHKDGPKEVELKASDMLATKILHGTLGCVPAYDKYFKSGLERKGLPENFNNLNELIKSILPFEHQTKKFEKIVGKKYPVMRLVDMYFWNVGKGVIE